MGPSAQLTCSPRKLVLVPSLEGRVTLMSQEEEGGQCGWSGTLGGRYEVGVEIRLT